MSHENVPLGVFEYIMPCDFWKEAEIFIVGIHVQMDIGHNVQ